MKRAIAVKERDGGYVVYVNDNGFICTMSELKKDGWETCIFPTYEEAERAKDDYNRTWIG